MIPAFTKYLLTGLDIYLFTYLLGNIMLGWAGVHRVYVCQTL